VYLEGFVGVSGWTVGRVLDLAIQMEEQSVQLYESARKRVLSPGSRAMLKELAVEEEGHRRLLVEAMEHPEKVGGIGAAGGVLDLEIVDHLESAALSPGADYQQILIYAAKREKETHDLYVELARKYRGRDVGEMFARLAQEELKHKFKLEKEYDDVVLAEM